MDLSKLKPAPWYESHDSLCCDGPMGGVSPVPLDRLHRDFIARARNSFDGDQESLAWWEANRKAKKKPSHGECDDESRRTWQQAFFRLLLWRFTASVTHTVMMANPWHEGRYTYATDGRMALRIEGDLEIPTLLAKDWDASNNSWPEKRPNIAPMFEGIDTSLTDQWLPMPVINPQLRLGIDMDCYHDHEYTIRLGGEWFDGNRLFWFSLIPSCRVLVRGKEKPSVFVFPGGMGMLMPLDKSERTNSREV